MGVLLEVTVMFQLFVNVQATGCVIETSSIEKSFPLEDVFRLINTSSAVVFDPLFQV